MTTYRSTRGAVNGASFQKVVLAGLAPDRGLFVPETVPTFTPKEVRYKNFFIISSFVAYSAANLGPPA